MTLRERRSLLRGLAALGALGLVHERAHAQEARTAGTAGGRVVFENDKLRVLEHLGRARLSVCGNGLHSHPPHLTVCLTDVKARVTIEGRPPFIDEKKAGDVFWDPGGAHVVENLGSRDTRSYLVELKDR
jgi:hypothetical protein